MIFIILKRDGERGRNNEMCVKLTVKTVYECDHMADKC